MAIILKVNFVTQLGIGGNNAGVAGRDDPTGCWYASASMIGHYFEEGPRLGLPELFKMDLGKGVLGHYATGSTQADALSKQHHQLLAQREHLEPVENCEKAYNYTLEELDNLLRNRGPIFMYWTKQHGTNRYGHASVIIGTDNAGIIYHDPERAPNSRMSLAQFNTNRQKWAYALMQRIAAPGVAPINSQKHRVMAGESFSIIAGKYWNNDVLLWPLIWDANKKKVPVPRQLPAGIEIFIPDISVLSETEKTRIRQRGRTQG